MIRNRHWFDAARAHGAWVSLILALGFNLHWMWQYDVCVRRDEAASAQVRCLMTSLFSVYVDWWLHIWLVITRAAKLAL